MGLLNETVKLKKMNLYYDDFEYNTEVINEVIKDFITKPTK